MASRLAAVLACCGAASACGDGGPPTEPPPAVNQRPIARFTVDHVRGSIPLTVTFDASASSDPDGRIDSYTWDFADGGTASGRVVTHSYTSVGQYTPILTVTDDRGASAREVGDFIVAVSPDGSGLGTINGSIWHDLNANGVREPGEPPVTWMTVYLDQDDSGTRGAAELATLAAADGRFTFTGLDETTPYTVRQDLTNRWTNTFAGHGTGARPAADPPNPIAGGPDPTTGAGSLQAESPARIIGGDTAVAGEFPFQVALLFAAVSSNERALTCGGTLIAGSWVLTAAHCVTGAGGVVRNPAEYEVLIGTHSLVRGGERVAVRRLHVFPAFAARTFVGNDIALMELDGYFLSPRIRLMTRNELRMAQAGTVATVIGWGRTSTGGPISPVLKKVEAPIISNDECRTILGEEVVASTICAGRAGTPDGVCNGDSGGPLLVPFEEGWIQAGIVSFGFFTCVNPEAYARVTELIDFVLDRVPAEPSRAVTVDWSGGLDANVSFGNFR